MAGRCRRALICAAVSLTASALVATAAWAAPSITSFTPTSGPLGTTVTITGSGFTGARSVAFGGVSATFSIVSDTSIRATVPTLAHSGAISVTASSGTGTSAGSFTVKPGIALSAGAGPPTTQLTVSGSGFAANEAVDIYEDATDVVVAATDAFGTVSNIPVRIPAWKPPGTSWFSAVGRRSQLAAQIGFTVRTDWNNGRGDATSAGYNQFENVLDTSSVQKLQLSWTTAGANFLSNGPPGVVVAGGMVAGLEAVRSAVTVRRLDGSLVWSKTLNTSFFSGPAPAEGGGVMVVASTDGKVHAWTFSTGAVKWTSAGPSDTGNGSPVIAGSTVFVPGATTLTAYSLSTGAVRWSYTGPCTGNLSAPAVIGSTVLFTCTNSGGSPVLVSLGTDGTFYHWFSTAGGTTSAPAGQGGNVYTLLGGNLVAYSASGFNPKWNVTPPISVSTDPAAGDGIVATCGSGGLWVVNAVNGSTRFTNATYACSAPVTIANGVIFEPRNGDVVMYDEYGTPLGRLGSGGNVGPVAVSDGAVYAADSIAGEDRWAIPVGASIARVSHARPVARRLHPNLKLRPYRRHRRG